MSDRTRWPSPLPDVMARFRRSPAPLTRVDHRLLLIADALHDVDSGREQPIDSTAPDPRAVAAAAARLCPRHRQSRRPTVQLLLPPPCCVATTVTLPGVAPEAVPAALQLQVDSLLPGHEGALALAVHPGCDPDALDEVALWMPQSYLDTWFEAFHDAGLLLVAVQPRNIAAVEGSDEAWLLDADREHQTLLHWKHGALRAWHQVHRRDLEQDAFRQQWQALLDASGGGNHQVLQSGSALPARLRGESSTGDDPYSFRPRGALEEARRHRRRRRQLTAAAAGVAALLLAAMPFLWQSVQMLQLESRLAGTRAEAAAARADQAAVRDFETRWEVLTAFPRQSVDGLLLDLQDVLLPSVLDSLELQEGYVNIEGRSPDPQRLLQDLEAHERFTGVDFAAATSNDRYSIDLRLTTVDFAAYYDWYFPERR